jgi:hypothetical protein
MWGYMLWVMGYGFGFRFGVKGSDDGGMGCWA